MWTRKTLNTYKLPNSINFNLHATATSLVWQQKLLTHTQVLVSGWMGSTSKHLRRFREAYHARGCDVFEFSAGPMVRHTVYVCSMCIPLILFSLAISRGSSKSSRRAWEM